MSYSLKYTIAAATYLEAVTAAVSMLRTGIKLRGVTHVTEAGGMWTVVLNVWEDV